MSAAQPVTHNPYLPSWEYIPDGEPHVFGDRVYVYGSHDRFNGFVYCMNDYVCWSAPLDDLGDWRYEGIIYRKDQDPENPDGAAALFAPDVTQGPDGRYYLYYCLNDRSLVSVAVCDSPAGAYRFYGYVHDAAGVRLGARPGDENQFDPAVLTEGAVTYLYTGGVCFPADPKPHGAMCTRLAADMLTMLGEPVFVVPSTAARRQAEQDGDTRGASFRDHEFFEASSIRRLDGRYYFVYSSIHMNELCYAVSDRPDGGYRYGGVIVSNCDMGLANGKEPAQRIYPAGNNHGGLVRVRDDTYIFYHRHTNATEYSRQGCFERVRMLLDGSIPQVEISSCCGGAPLEARGEHPAYLACCLFREERPSSAFGPEWLSLPPRVTQDGRDGDEEPGYIAQVTDGTTIGYKYFRMSQIRRITVRTRGYLRGSFELRTELNGPVIGSIGGVVYRNVWTAFSGEAALPDGVHALYFTFRGEGCGMFGAFTME